MTSPRSEYRAFPIKQQKITLPPLKIKSFSVLTGKYPVPLSISSFSWAVVDGISHLLTMTVLLTDPLRNSHAPLPKPHCAAGTHPGTAV